MYYYLKDKRDLMWTIWTMMEEIHDTYPFYQFGWDGFVPMIHEGGW